MTADVRREQLAAPAAHVEQKSRIPAVSGVHVEPEAVGELSDLMSQLSITEHNGPTVSTRRIFAKMRRSKVPRVARKRVGKPRSPRLTRSHVDEIPTNRRGVMMERMRRLQSLVDEQILADGGVGADEIIGVRCEGATELVKVGAGADSAMVGLEFDTIDEVMIGSDVEAEMDESSDSDDDTGVVDGDSMQLDEDGPADFMDLEDDSPLVGSSQAGNLGLNAQCGGGSARFESINDRLKRAKAGSAFRETFDAAVNSKKIVSGSMGASTPSNSQHSVTVPTPVNNQVAIMPQGAVCNPIPANSDADLKEARLGKQPEEKTASSQVAGPSQPSAAPASTLPPKSSSSEESTIENESAAESTQTTMTPASTLPSSASSTPPDSLVRKKTLKSGPSKVSTTKKALRTEPTKRKASASAAGLEKKDSGSSSTPQPKTDSSSKRVQQKRPGDAQADQEVVPLNEIAEKTLTGTFSPPIAVPFPLKRHRICTMLYPFIMYILLFSFLE